MNKFYLIQNTCRLFETHLRSKKRLIVLKYSKNYDKITL